MADNFDMHNMKESVKETIRHCEACQRTKVVTTKTREETIKLTATEPGEKIYIDICGPLNETFRKKKYIIGIIDHFSRYISLTAISRQDEETIKEIILTKWILKLGAPKEIHVDCGKAFESKGMKEFAEEMEIKLVFSSPYHHNTNGMIERQFRTMRDLINASVKEKKQKDWAQILPDIEFTLNATFQKTIGRSPAEIMLGRKICRERWYGNTRSQQKEHPKTEHEIVYPTRRSFDIGDEVLVEVEARSKDKDRFEGPYRVIQKVHDRRYLLKDQEGKTIQRNVEKLKQFLKEGG